MVIYKATNSVNGKVYVGKTSRKPGVRWSQHRDDARNGYRKGRGKYRFAAAIRKYGVEAFLFEVIDTAATVEELNQKEIDWIARLDATNREKGYNLTKGGDRPVHAEGSKVRQKGYKRDPAIGVKISLALRNSEAFKNSFTSERRAAWSTKRKGVPVSPERAAAMKANPPGLGTKRTPEQRANMSRGIKIAYASEELRARVSRIQKESRALKPRPGHSLSEENKQKVLAASRARWASLTPEERREIMKERQAKAAIVACLPENVAKRTEAIRRAWTPEKRAAAAARAREENQIQRILNARERKAS